jgi:hypothetical protein
MFWLNLAMSGPLSAPDKSPSELAEGEGWLEVASSAWLPRLPSPSFHVIRIVNRVKIAYTIIFLT